MFQRTKLCTSLLVAFSGAVALTGGPAFAQDAKAERVEVTGSRIKRVDAEGALPIATFSREELQASGATTVAEFVRNMTFTSGGNFRPQSGSSAQSFSGVDLRGLGSERTLVLIDGRRVVKAPHVGSSSDLSSIPMAAIERVEVLTDGASAIYGSDAISGVVNFITRKDFQGAEVTIGETNNSLAGGDRQEASAVVGVIGDKGRALLGVASTNRDIVYSNQRPWGAPETVGSTFSNNWVGWPGPGLNAVDGGCSAPNFFLVPNTAKGAAAGSQTCLYDYRATAADEASLSNKTVFFYGEAAINDDWRSYLTGSVNRVSSFGRYAPTPSSPFLGSSSILVPKTSPNNPTRGTADEQDLRLRHRFAATGNRDTTIENVVYDYTAGIQGAIGDIDLDAGIRFSNSKYNENGNGYIVAQIAQQFIADGTYNIFDPSSNPAEVLQGMSATIGRDSFYKQKVLFANASKPLFKLGGGTVLGSLGLEHREETYADKYDSLSEAGQIVGSAGNSSSGKRDIDSIYGELVFPVTKNLEAGLAARYEKYSDYGGDFSPKAYVAFKPLSSLKLRASAGKGFRAPSLDILNAKTTFSAESVIDARTAAAYGVPASQSVQVTTYFQSNPNLKSEKSNQFSFGAIWDATQNLSFKADYWNIAIEDTIVSFGGATLVNRDNGVSNLPIPAGLSVERDPVTGEITRVNAGYGNEGTLKSSGLDLNTAFKYKVGSYGSINHELSYTRVLKRTVNGDETIGTYGLPKHRASFATKWTFGDFDATWNVNGIGSSQDVDSDSGDVYKLPTYVSHDIQVGWNTPWKGRLAIGAVNVTEKLPVVDEYSGRPFYFDLYDYYGRQVYFRYTQKF